MGKVKGYDMPGDTESSNEQNQKAQKEFFDAQQKSYRGLLQRIVDIEIHLKHALPSLGHQVTPERVRKLLENDSSAELEKSITDAKEISKSLEALNALKQTLQQAQKTNNRKEAQNLKSKIDNKLGDAPTLKQDLVYMETNIKLLSEVNKEIHRIEKTVVKAHEVMAKMKHDFDKLKKGILEKGLVPKQKTDKKMNKT